MIITDGVEEEEVITLREEFERERAKLIITAPHEYLHIETVREGKRGASFLVDIPLEAVEVNQYAALVIPDGILSTELLCRDERVLDLVQTFHQNGQPIFASGAAIKLLHDCHVLSDQIVVREGSSLGAFVDKAVEVLLDSGSPYRYRPAIVS